MAYSAFRRLFGVGVGIGVGSGVAACLRGRSGIAPCSVRMLDSVFGVGGWRDSYQLVNGGSVVCTLSVKVDGEWVDKVDVGSPSEQPDDGDKLKAAFSDALKRAAVKLGIGRYLYKLPRQWCEYDPQRRQFVRPPTLPSWALPTVKQSA
jgi:hypothetical protein